MQGLTRGFLTSSMLSDLTPPLFRGICIDIYLHCPAGYSVFSYLNLSVEVLWVLKSPVL